MLNILLNNWKILMIVKIETTVLLAVGIVILVLFWNQNNRQKVYMMDIIDTQYVHQLTKCSIMKQTWQERKK